MRKDADTKKDLSRERTRVCLTRINKPNVNLSGAYVLTSARRAISASGANFDGK